MGPMGYDFAGLAVIVTGGGSGIGEVTAAEFLRMGARVAIVGRKLDRLEAAAAKMREKTGGEVICIAADVRDQAQCNAMIEQVAKAFGGIDILINNAGGGWHARLRDMPIEGWNRDIALNLNSAFYCTQAAYPWLKAKGNGRIVNISSLAGVNGTMGHSAYSAAKAGLQMFTRVTAAEWGPSGIRSNCVACGMIATDLAKAAWARTGFDPKDACTAFPLRRPGTPEEVAAAVLFMASDASSYITGETLTVGGGPQLKGMGDVAD